MLVSERSPSTNSTSVLPSHGRDPAFLQDADDLVRPRPDLAEIAGGHDLVERPVSIDIVQNRAQREIESVNIGHDGNAHRIFLAGPLAERLPLLQAYPQPRRRGKVETGRIASLSTTARSMGFGARISYSFGGNTLFHSWKVTDSTIPPVIE